jgi:two-component system response regulator FlrC
MKLLIIGNLDGQIGAASRIARNRGAKVAQVSDIEAAYEMMCDGQSADVIMIEVHEDIALLKSKIDEARIHVSIIACGIKADAPAAAKAIRAGAKEYIPLPPDEELIAAVLEAITEESHAVIHGDDATRRVLHIADQIAPSDASVLITGESGTGKEVFARYLYQKSNRSTKPFVSINCAAIPENLLESELFGYEKGAFTGAISRRVGKFEEANGGTLFLDEISEMAHHLQAKLLRAIQEREITRIGSNKAISVDIRILATSNRDLESYVKEGKFREDLYFRLNVINLELPSLRERLGDIQPLSEHFIEKFSKANGLPPRALPQAALEKLQQHGWPGNVRELQNVMQRSLLMAQGNQIDADDIMITTAQLAASAQRDQDDIRPSFGADARTTSASQSAQQPTQEAARIGKPNDLVGRSVASVEKELILDTLDYCLGNRTQAANILGISIRTLRNKLKQYDESEKAG